MLVFPKILSQSEEAKTQVTSTKIIVEWCLHRHVIIHEWTNKIDRTLVTYSCLLFYFSHCCITNIFPLLIEKRKNPTNSENVHCILIITTMKNLIECIYLINHSCGKLPHTCSTEFSTLFLDHQHLLKNKICKPKLIVSLLHDLQREHVKRSIVAHLVVGYHSHVCCVHVALLTRCVLARKRLKVCPP